MRMALAISAIAVFGAACGSDATRSDSRGTSPTPSPTLSSVAVSTACQAQRELEAALQAIEDHTGTSTATADNLLFIQGDWVTAAGYAHDDNRQTYVAQYLGISSDIDQVKSALSGGDSAAVQAAINSIQADVARLPRLACP